LSGDIEFIRDESAAPSIEGFLHRPASPTVGSIVLTHGAGGNCQSKLLVSMATAFADAGFLVLRCNLPFRQERPTGPPSPGSASRDREGLGRAVALLKRISGGPIYMGGHSYGGRQASMLAAEHPDLVAALLLFSYPLHPPRRPTQLRTAHLPQLRTPAMFVHGSRDPFGSLEEMQSALGLIPAPTLLIPVDRAGHELMGKSSAGELPSTVVKTFVDFVSATD
jgi:uncharacterized protein